MNQEQHVRRFVADLSRKLRKASKPSTRSADDPVAAMAAELDRLRKAEDKTVGDDRTAHDRFIEVLRQQGSGLEAAE